MNGRLLIYGAAGYTGRLIARAVREEGTEAVVCGRSREKLAPLASELGVELRVSDVEDRENLDHCLDGIHTVLNAAGPFGRTAIPLIEACLRKGVHYLDITGEAAVIEAESRRDQEAKVRKVMVMPAVGFDVVPSDCLAAHVAHRVRAPQRLFVGMSGLDLLTRGSTKTIIEQMGDPVWVRRGGRLDHVPPGALERTFDYGSGPRASVAVTWGDVVTAYLTTGIPDITVYSEATPAVKAHHLFVQSFRWAIQQGVGRAFLRAGADWMPDGPSEDERVRRRLVIVAEVEDDDGRRVCSRMRTPEPYSMTAATASAIAARVLAGDLEPGFQTPARVYGADFPLSLPGVVREDL